MISVKRIYNNFESLIDKNKITIYIYTYYIYTISILYIIYIYNIYIIYIYIYIYILYIYTIYIYIAFVCKICKKTENWKIFLIPFQINFTYFPTLWLIFSLIYPDSFNFCILTFTNLIFDFICLHILFLSPIDIFAVRALLNALLIVFYFCEHIIME